MLISGIASIFDLISWQSYDNLFSGYRNTPRFGAESSAIQDLDDFGPMNEILCPADNGLVGTQSTYPLSGNKVNPMHPILTEPSRKDKFKAWLLEHGITYQVLAELMGMSKHHVCKLVNRDYATPERVARLRELNVPKDLLPEPRRPRPGRKPKNPSAAGLPGDSHAQA